jgi:hypothetical protein
MGIGGDGLSIFMLIMFAAILCLSCTVVGSTVFFLSRARGQQGRLEGGESGADVARLQASIDELTSQVHLLEEEKEFYRELKAPQDTPRDGSDSKEAG